MTDRIIAFSILCLVFGLPLGVAALFTGELILDFVFFWPLFMSVLWVTGGLYFWFQLERHWSWDNATPAPALAGEPLISILIPCFNEERNARETISAALGQRYWNVEVIAINDGSSDNTAQVLHQLAQEQPRLRVINLAENQGKAVALKADWSYSGGRVFFHYWSYQANAADLWPGLYGLRRHRRLSPTGAGGCRVLEPGYDHRGH